MPTKQEIDNIKCLLADAFTQLKLNDNDLIKLPNDEVRDINETDKILERALHEICINHRLAFYIETLIVKHLKTNEYKVDIEYNRLYNKSKVVYMLNKEEKVRPDIIIHKRTIELGIQHLMIIEVKKDCFDDYDITKVQAFMNDSRYQYVFGVVVNYNEFNPIKARLYYKQNNDIEKENLDF